MFFRLFLHHCFAFVLPQPENIMMSDKQVPNPNIKIIDFGMAHCFLQGVEYKSTGGTPQYIGKTDILVLIVLNLNEHLVKILSMGVFRSDSLHGDERKFRKSHEQDEK